MRSIITTNAEKPGTGNVPVPVVIGDSMIQIEGSIAYAQAPELLPSLPPVQELTV